MPLQIDTLDANRGFLVSEDLDEVCRGAADFINRAVAAMSTTIFLFSKRGRLARRAASGDLPPALKHEEYEPTANTLVGRSVLAQPGEKYARLRVYHNPMDEWGDDYFTEYMTRLDNATVVTLPLNGPNRTYGTIRCIRLLSFTEDELGALSVIAHQIAISISSIRRKLELDVSSGISTLLTADVKVDEIFAAVASRLVEQWTDFAACSIRILDRDGNLSLAGVKGAPGVSLATKMTIARDPYSGLPGRALATRQPAIIRNVRDHLDMFFDRVWISEHNFATAALFPIFSENTNVGTLMLFLWYDFEFAPSNLRFIEGVCHQLATAHGMARLVRARDELILRLHDLASPVSSTELLQRILNSARDLTGGSEGYIALTSRHDNLLHPSTFTGGLTEADIPAITVEGRGLTALAMRRRASVNCRNVRGDDEYAAQFVDLIGPWAGRIHSELVVPLAYEQTVIGVIVIESEQVLCFDEGDVAILETLAGTASLVYQRQRFHDATAKLAGLALPRTAAAAAYDAITRTAIELADADAAVLCMLDSPSQRLRVAASAPETLASVPNDLPAETGVTWRALEDHDVTYFENLDAAHGFHHVAFAEDNSLTSMVAIPLFVSTGVGNERLDLGVLNLFFRRVQALFTAERQVLQAFAVTAAHAVYDADVLHERERRSQLAATTARLRAVMSVSEAVNDLLQPVRHLETILRRTRQGLVRADERVARPENVLGEALHDVRLIRAVVERITPEGKALARHVRAGEPTERLTQALKTLSQQWVADTLGPRLHITAEQLWSTIKERLGRAAGVLNLDVAAAYMADRSDYTDLRLVAQSRAWRGLTDLVALPSFDHFIHIERNGPFTAPTTDPTFQWLRPPELFGTTQAVVYAREVIGGHLVLFVFGWAGERILSFPEQAILHEIVTQQLLSYLDNAMFGLELDHFTAETGHLMGRAVGKVRGGIDALEEVLPASATIKNLQYGLARRSIDDGITRLEMIRQNFYSFSVQRRGGGVSSDDAEPLADLDVFDAFGTLLSMREFFDREAHEAHLRPVQYDIRGVKARVRGDENLLNVTFLNLFDNAVKFAYNDTYITVRARLIDDECNFLFENLGVGVAPGEEKLVFRRLRKSRFRSPYRLTEGLGMGLAFCRRVVEGVFRGRITLTSREIETRRKPRFEGDNWLTVVTVALPLIGGDED